MDEEKCYLLTGKLDNDSDMSLFKTAEYICKERNINFISPENVASEITDFKKTLPEEDSNLDWGSYIVGLIGNLVFYCDGIILMPDWEKSREAKTLKAICEIYDREIQYFNEFFGSNSNKGEQYAGKEER